ncbi:MAG: WbqC family protein [Bacteroidota bacterium]
MTKILLTTAYLPPIDYIKAIMEASEVEIEYCENYQKRTYRNRAIILTANGPLSLSIPVNKPKGNHTPINEITIDNTENWQHDHWQAIKSAYNRSPFYEYYADLLSPIYQQEKQLLVDFNQEVLQIIFKIIGKKLSVNHSNTFIKSPLDVIDLRDIHQIHKQGKTIYCIPEYPQVFDYKHPFTSPVSILDLIFNQGNYCPIYLQSMQKTNLI